MAQIRDAAMTPELAAARNLAVTRAARKLQAARQRLDVAMAEAAQAAQYAHASGATEVDIAREIGVNRMTVRRWLGKL